MHYTIRKAEPKDAPQIAKVHVETWQSHYRGLIPDDILDELSIDQRTKFWEETLSDQNSKSATFVSEDNGTISGFCKVGPSRDENAPDETGELHSMYLMPSKQGEGIGSSLMKTGLNFLREQRFKRATLWVLKTNLKAIKFYESKGWKFDGKIKNTQNNNFTFEDIRCSINL